MRSGQALRILRAMMILGAIISLSLAVDTSHNMFGDLTYGIHGSVNEFFSGNVLTGLVPFEETRLPVSPQQTEEQLLANVRMDLDNKILGKCSRAHSNSADCFYLLKSIMSATSQGDEGYSSELGRGIIPLRDSQTELSEDELVDPGTNLREASRYLMRLYDSYNGDLAFTTMAYFSNRAVSNSIMYSLSERDVETITARVMLSELERQYESLDADLDILPLEDIAQYYVDSLFAYNFWADRPMADSSVEQLMYDHGTISINPSFSSSIRYDIKQMVEVRDIISSYVGTSSSRRTSDGAYEDQDLSFVGLRSHIMQNHEDYELLSAADDAPISMNNLTWKRGMCNPMLDKFNRVVDRFIQCVELDEIDCYCDFSDIIFDHDDYEIFMEVRESTTEMGIPRKDMIFELRRGASGARTEGELMASSTHLSYLEGSREQEFVFGGLGEFDDSLEGLRNDQVIFTNVDGENWFAGPGHPEYHPSIYKGELEEKIGLALVPVNNDDLDLDLNVACEIEQEYEHICIESETAYAYDDFFDDYLPIGHQFAFSLYPMELRGETWKSDSTNLGPLEVDARYSPSLHPATGIVADDAEEENILTLHPGRSCDDDRRCNNDIILGKPSSYTNQREKIVLHNLSFDDYSDALDYFIKRLSSAGDSVDGLHDKHYGVHYILDADSNTIFKLAREDAVLKFSRFHDSESIHVGLIVDGEIDGQYMDLILSKLSEILLRNDLNSYRLVPSNNLELPNWVDEDYDYTYPKEHHLDRDIFFGIQGTVNEMIQQYKDGGVSQED